MAGLVRTPITMWTSRKDDVPPIEWAWAEERLQRCEDYWVITVPGSAAAGGGPPAARPVWGVWLAGPGGPTGSAGDGRLLLTLGSTTHWRNLETNSAVSVTTGDAHEVVIVEGEAATEDDPTTLAAMVAAYNAKYGWDFPETGPDIGGVLAVTPRTVLAWIAGPTGEAKTNAFPLAASRWVGP